MEFLDDLREQREAGKRDSKSKPSSQDRVTEQEDPWEALIAGASFDESEGAGPESAPQSDQGHSGKAPRRRQISGSRRDSRTKAMRHGMSGAQKMLLGLLALLVLLVLVVMAAALSGWLPLSALFGSDENVVPTLDAAMSLLEEPETAAPIVPAPTPTAIHKVEAPTIVPLPTATPIPVPVVSTVYDNQIIRDPENVDLYLKRGAEYLSLGVYDAAFDDYERAITLNDQRFEGYLGLGWSMYYVFDWTGAKAGFDAAVVLNPDADEAHFGLGLLHYYQGAYADAAREFDMAAEINPLNAEAEAWLAISAAKLGDTQEAVDAVARALNTTQELPIVYIARSWAHRIQAPPNLEGAHADLLYALDLESNEFLTLDALASFYADYRPDRLSEAELRAIYARDWAENPVEEALALQTLGHVYLALDRKADAERVLTEAKELSTRDGNTYLVSLEDDLARAR